MTSYDGATIKILNWEKYNPRGDTKKPSWFRFENNFYNCQTFTDLDSDESHVAIFLFCWACQKNTDRLTFKIKYVVDSLVRVKVTEEKVLSALQKLQADQVIKISECYSDEEPVRDPHGSVHDPHGSVHDPHGFVQIPPATGRDERDERTGRDETNGTCELELTSPDTDSNFPRIVNLWNELADEKLPRVREMPKKSKRRSACDERWREKPDESYWREVILRLNGSSFCTGSNDRGWVANIDFLTRPDTAAKILEGIYDSRPGQSRTQTKQSAMSQANRELLAKVEAGEA